MVAACDGRNVPAGGHYKQVLWHCSELQSRRALYFGAYVTSGQRWPQDSDAYQTTKPAGINSPLFGTHTPTYTLRHCRASLLVEGSCRFLSGLWTVLSDHHCGPEHYCKPVMNLPWCEQEELFWKSHAAKVKSYALRKAGEMVQRCWIAKTLTPGHAVAALFVLL